MFAANVTVDIERRILSCVSEDGVVSLGVLDVHDVLVEAIRQDDVGCLDTMEYQVDEADDVSEALLFLSAEGLRLKRLKLRG